MCGVWDILGIKVLKEAVADPVFTDSTSDIKHLKCIGVGRRDSSAIIDADRG